VATVTKTIGATGRDYSTITAWEADLDNAAIYAAGDDAVGECYDDATFSGEAVTINGGGTVGLASRTLRAAAGHEHDGTAGTGVRIVPVSATISITLSLLSRVEGLELDGNGTSQLAFLQTNWGNSTGTPNYGFHRCLVHNVSNSSHIRALQENGNYSYFTNCIVYRLDGGASSSAMTAAMAPISSSRAAYYINCTAWGITRVSGTGVCTAVNFGTLSNKVAINCIGGGCSHGGTGVDDAFYISGTPSGTSITYSASDDASAVWTGCISGATLGFVSTTAGSEDLHLASDSDAIDSGSDLGTTYGSNIDIDGRDRDSEGDTWDMGADEYVAEAGGTTYEETPTGALTPAGAMLVAAAKALVGALTNSGSLLASRTFARAYDGTLTLFANVTNLVNKAFSGVTTPTAAVTFLKSQTREFAAELSSMGALNKVTSLVKTATSATSGAFSRTMSSVRAFTGTITPAGITARAASYVRTFTGTFTPAALFETAVVKLKLLESALTSSGTLVRHTARTVLGALTSSGVPVRVSAFVRSLTSTLTMNGALTRVASLIRAGALTTSSIILRTATVVRAGTLTFVGALRKTPTRLYGATLTVGGALLRTARTSLVGATSASGAMLKNISVTRAGTLTNSATVLVERVASAINLTLTGALAAASALHRQLSVFRTGTLTPTGVPVKSFTTRILGTLTPQALLRKASMLVKFGALTSSNVVEALGVRLRVLTSTLTSAASAVKHITKSSIAVLTPSSNTPRRVEHTETGNAAPEATLVRNTRLNRAGQLTSNGVATTFRFMLVTLSGALTMFGITRRTFAKLAAGAVAATASRARDVRVVLARTFTSTGVSRLFRELVLTRAFSFVSWLTTLVRRAQQRPLTIDVRASTSDVVLDAALSRIECRARRSFFSLRAHNRRK
jgi:hypothetical protein